MATVEDKYWESQWIIGYHTMPVADRIAHDFAAEKTEESLEAAKE